jgi:hypothetical protein
MGAVAKSAYLRDNLIEHALGVASFTMPTNVFLALFTTDPTINNTGTELSGGSYARQQLSLAAASNGRCASNTAETFSSLPACIITHWGIYDASTNGNLLYFGKFDIPIIRNAAEDLVIASGNIAVSEA